MDMRTVGTVCLAFVIGLRVFTLTLIVLFELPFKGPEQQGTDHNVQQNSAQDQKTARAARKNRLAQRAATDVTTTTELTRTREEPKPVTPPIKKPKSQKSSTYALPIMPKLAMRPPNTAVFRQPNSLVNALEIGPVSSWRAEISPPIKATLVLDQPRSVSIFSKNIPKHPLKSDASM
ncbi:hypothetical protein BpHYR1_002095 [Brachionus plicatilis]|uniref:Uncharacterized protein n=1 Tax=Brachionus plicatilis TaxID=10195 RepID=A0A3M7TA20_BRAPC|nr:hypothetical protein BpHYR1_002095 [Brachionus plicatilis]